MFGFSNELELDFARYLDSINKPIWIRQVLVPGFTDDEEDLLKLKEFLSSLSNVEKVEILPYHDLGKFKWEALNLDYPLQGVRSATAEDVERAKAILRDLSGRENIVIVEASATSICLGFYWGFFCVNYFRLILYGLVAVQLFFSSL